MQAIIDGLILTTVFLGLWSGHWMQWHWIPRLVDAEGNLKRVPAYTYGVTWILIGFAALAVVRGVIEPVLWLVAVVVVACVGTVLPRLIRYWIERQAHTADLEARHGANGKR
jgi:hypothetical protein